MAFAPLTTKQKDYYQIMGITKQASQQDIAQAYRRLALVLHPDKNKENGKLAVATYAFTEICEAYEVLSTKELKEAYDRFGEELMKTGVPDKKYGFKAGYKFQGNSFEIFEKFFGTQNPFAVALDEHSQVIGALEAKKQLTKMEQHQKRFANLEVKVECTLEEFYHGCQKNISFEKLTVMEDGIRQKMVVMQKDIHIKPGMFSQQKITYPGEGHQRVGMHPADLIIILSQKPHETFKRVSNDLILEHKISLVDALNAGPVLFKTIEGEQIEISIDQVISPGYFKVIPGKGMPILNNNPLGPIKKDYGRGNLILKFDIQFPK